MTDIYDLQESYRKKKDLINQRLSEFRKVLLHGDDHRIFEELVYCILAANTSARMSMNSVDKIKDILMESDVYTLSSRLKGIYRFYNKRAEYIVHTRDFLKREYNFRLKEHLLSYGCYLSRRDFLAASKNIKGIGFKEASHFLRNIGFRGYAILDKHVVRCLYELGILRTKKIPSGREQYLETERKMMEFAEDKDFDIDQLDLLLWSERTGEILK